MIKIKSKDPSEFSLIGRILHYSLIPLTLLIAVPPFIMLLSHCGLHLNGSFAALVEELFEKGLLKLLEEQWLPVVFGTPNAWRIILIFSALQLLLIKILPGRQYHAPMHPSGHIPEYYDNGLLAYFVTCVLFFVCTFGLNLFPATIIIDNFHEILGSLNASALVFCVFLLIKGVTFPSSEECGSSGNIIFDFYWGTELYPRIFGWDVKLFTNSRFGLMFWQMTIFSICAKQYEELEYITDSMLVCALLQTQYLFKFYFWEEGYLKSTDIVVDRAGFYLCWGCLVFITGIFNTPNIYLLQNPVTLGPLLTLTLILLGVFFTWLTFWVDQQKVIVRNTQGNCLVFGKKPKIIIAKYKTFDDKEKSSLLLCSGFWGISRQFHFIPEWLASLAWSSTALISHSIYPYVYLLVLLAILVQRSFRDEEKCKLKYGKDWERYCEAVPARIIPYIF